MLKENPVVKKMFEMGEEQVGRVTQQLLSSEMFVAAVQTIVNNSLKAKGLLDKNIRLALSAMNLPSIADVENLKTKIEELDQVIRRLEEALNKIADQQKPQE